MRARTLAMLGIVVFLAAGCSGCRSDEESCVPGIRIESPAEGDVISPHMDEEPNRAGMQVTVAASVDTCVPDGTLVRLLVNDDVHRSRDSVTRGGQAIFETVTLVPFDSEGRVKLTAMVLDADLELVDQHTVSVHFDQPPSVSCFFVAPIEGVVLGPDDDVMPERVGMRYDVVIRCEADLDGAPAALTVDDAPVPTAIFVGDTVTFPAVHLSEGNNLIRGVVTTEAGTWTGYVSVTVDTPDCEVRLQPAGAIVFNLDGDPPRVPGREAIADADGDPSNGIQVDFVMPAADCLGGRASLFVDGEVVDEQLVELEKVEFDRITLPDGDDVRVHVEVTPVVDEVPTGRSVTQSFWVDSVRPAPILLFPSDGEVLRGEVDKDQDATNGVQVDVYIEAPTLERFDDPSVPWRAALIEVHLTRTDLPGNGQTRTYTCLVGIDGCRESGAANRYRIEVDLEPVADYELEVVVTDPAGNVGKDGPARFSVDARPISLVITSPQQGEVVSLEHPGIEDARVPVVVQSDAAEVLGLEARVSCLGAPTALGTFGQDGRAEMMVDFSALSCGAEATSCTARVILDDIEHQSEAVDFKVDLSPPEISIVAPYDGAILHETDVLIEVVALCLEDGQGVAILERESRTILGSSPASAGVALVPLTLSSGQHTVLAETSDAAGNLAFSEQITFVVAGDPPMVTFVSPIDGLMIVEDDDVDSETEGLQYDVIVQVGNEPEGTPVTLQIGYDDGGIPVWTAPLATAYTVGAGLRARFDGVTLPEGDIALRAIATGELGLRGEASIWTSVNTGAARCNIVSPVDGSAIGPAHDPGASPDTGVAHEVRVRTSIPAGEEVHLTLIDGRGNESVFTSMVHEGQAIFDEVVFTTGPEEGHGQNFLNALCADTGRALTSSVLVDLEAPEVSILQPSDGEIFNASSIDASAEEGFQILFRGVAQNPSSGRSVTAGAAGELMVDCDGAEPRAHSLTFASYGEDVEARARVTVEDRSTCTLSFVVTDAAGNTSQEAVVTVVVDLIPPELGISWPRDGHLFGTIDDLAPHLDGFQQRVDVEYAGLDDGLPVHLFLLRESEGWEQIEPDASPHFVGSETRSGWVFDSLTYTMEPNDEVVIQAVVEDAAGNVAISMVSVRVDTMAPQVAITRPAPGASCFNLLSDHAPQTSGIETKVDVAVSGMSSGLPLTLCGTSREETESSDCNVSGYKVIANSRVAGSFAVFEGVLLMEGEQEIIVETRDLAGNYSHSDPVSVCADSIPPRVVSFEVLADADGDGYINADELDAVGGVACFQLGVEGAEGQELKLRSSSPMAGTTIGSAIVAGREAIVCGQLGEGSHALEARVRDENGNPNLWPSSPQIENPEAKRTIFVDTISPTLAIVSPRSDINAELAGGHDVDPEVNFEVHSNAEGRDVVFEVDGETVGQATVTGGSASISTTLTNGETHLLQARVIDVAGNVSERAREVRVDTTPPIVTVLEPTDGSQLDDGRVSMTIDVSHAQSDGILRVYRVDVLPRILLHEGAVAGSQPQSIGVSLPDGPSTLVARAWDAAGNVGESTPVVVEVDTDSCSLVWTSPSVSSFIFNEDSDLEPETNGLRAAIAAHTVDCGGSMVELLKNDEPAVLDSRQASASTGDVVFEVDLENGESGSFLARIEDSQGRITEAVFEFLVDSSAPEIQRSYPESSRVAYVSRENRTVGSIDDEGYLRIEDLNPSDRANVQARFAFNVVGASGGHVTVQLDGTSIFGPAFVTADEQEFDVDEVLIPNMTDGILDLRVVDAAGNARSIRIDVKVDVAPPLPPRVEASVDDPRAATISLTWPSLIESNEGGDVVAVEVEWGLKGFEQPGHEDAYGEAELFAVDTSLVLSPLPPLNSYWITVRGRDALDNLSPLVEGVNSILVSNTWSRFELAGDYGEFGKRMLSRGIDLNGNGHDDIVVAAPSQDGGGESGARRGAVYVYYGRADPEELQPQLILGELDGEELGSSVDAGQITDDGVPTLILGARGYQENDGRVILLFGREDGQELDPHERLEIRGTEQQGDWFGSVVRVLGDISGNGIPDLAINAVGEGSLAGAVYVFFGRSKDEWLDLASAEGFVPVEDADLVLRGDGPPYYFGFSSGYADLGDFSGDGGDDFLVPSGSGEAYVFRSADVMADQEVFGEVLASSAFQEIIGEYFGFSKSGFGFSADGIHRHVALSMLHDSSTSVLLYRVDQDGLQANPFLALQQTPHQGVEPVGWGGAITYGDLTGNGFPDIAVGSGKEASHRVDIYFNLGIEPLFKEERPGSVLLGSNEMGRSVWMGDFTGDGNAEIAAAGTAGSGRLFLWAP